jgi:hypothetical protein
MARTKGDVPIKQHQAQHIEKNISTPEIEHVRDETAGKAGEDTGTPPNPHQTPTPTSSTPRPRLQQGERRHIATTAQSTIRFSPRVLGGGGGQYLDSAPNRTGGSHGRRCRDQHHRSGISPGHRVLPTSGSIHNQQNWAHRRIAGAGGFRNRVGDHQRAPRAKSSTC